MLNNIFGEKVDVEDFKKVVAKSNVSEGDRDILLQLLMEVIELFRRDLELAGTVNINPITVELIDPTQKPIRIASYKVSPKELEIMKDLVQDMQKIKACRPHMGKWGAPMMVVAKKDGTGRPVFDYRKTNPCITPKAWPLPRTEEIFDRLSRAKISFQK